MKQPIRYTIDRKLDNNHIKIPTATLLHIFYERGDKTITIEKKHYKERSGYYLYPVDVSDQTIDVDGHHQENQIGTLYTWTNAWEIYCYPDLKEAALQKMYTALETEKYRLINLANSIPVYEKTLWLQHYN